MSGELQGAKYCVGATCDETLAGNSAWGGTYPLGAIDAGATKTVKIRAQIKPSSTVSSIPNTASVSLQNPTDPSTANNSDTASTTVTRSADLKVLKTATATANAGEYVLYTVTVENLVQSDGTSAQLNDALSGELQGAKYCVGATCDETLAGNSAWGGTYPLGAIDAGATKTVKIRAQIKPSSTVSSIPNTASVSLQNPTDPSTANNSDTASTTVTRSADLKVLKTATATANAGEYVLYTVTVENLGQSDGTSAQLNDALSGELQGAKYCVGATCDETLAGNSAWGGTYPLGAIDAGATKTVKIRAQIKPSSTVSSIPNTASVSLQNPTDQRE